MITVLIRIRGLKKRDKTEKAALLPTRKGPHTWRPLLGAPTLLLDYVPGPEELEQAPPSPDYVPGPEHTDDEIVDEDQPGAKDASPIGQSPDYVSESDPEADPEEDGDEDPEEDPFDYPADGGDDGLICGGDRCHSRLMSLRHPTQSNSMHIVCLLGFLSSSSTTHVWSDAEVAVFSLFYLSINLSPYGPPLSLIRHWDIKLLMIRNVRAHAAMPLDRIELLGQTRICYTMDREIDVIQMRERLARHRLSHLPPPPLSRHLMETEARLSREAWRRSMDARLGCVFRDAEAGKRRLCRDKRVADSDHTRQQQLIQTLIVMQSLQGQCVSRALAHVMQKGIGDGQPHFERRRRRTALALFENAPTKHYEVQTLYIRSTEGVARSNMVDVSWLNLWNLKVPGTDVVDFRKATLGTYPTRSIAKYRALALKSSKTTQEAVEMATELMDKKVITMAERQAENKRKAYTAGTGERKPYGGSKPLCAKCNYHHDGLCAPKCHKCNKVGHFARDCRSTGNANNANNQRGTGTGQKPTCYECGVQGHYKRECPKLKNNKNRGNQAGNDRAPVKVYMVGRAGTNPDSNIVTGTFLLNNRYASILFDTGADRSFVSTEFSSQMDITPSTLDHYYNVELAEGRIIGLNTILRGCTLNILNHPFNINLMPVELDSFDAIIGMYWLAKYQAIIVCSEKMVRIPWGNETLIVHD
ncbi:reverse transcriptase domain-containing protein, partial [Tanacetum coccineum]